MYRVRMHYGHPDVFDRVFHITRGGISKASRVINISEDIFAGMTLGWWISLYCFFFSISRLCALFIPLNFYLLTNQNLQVLFCLFFVFCLRLTLGRWLFGISWISPRMLVETLASWRQNIGAIGVNRGIKLAFWRI